MEKSEFPTKEEYVKQGGCSGLYNKAKSLHDYYNTPEGKLSRRLYNLRNTKPISEAIKKISELENLLQISTLSSARKSSLTEELHELKQFVNTEEQKIKRHYNRLIDPEKLASF